MRYKLKPRPKFGNRRTITKFLLIPRCVDGEWRWLETANIHQVYLSCGSWFNENWVDEI